MSWSNTTVVVTVSPAFTTPVGACVVETTTGSFGTYRPDARYRPALSACAALTLTSRRSVWLAAYSTFMLPIVHASESPSVVAWPPITSLWSTAREYTTSARTFPAISSTVAPLTDRAPKRTSAPSGATGPASEIPPSRAWSRYTDIVPSVWPTSPIRCHAPLSYSRVPSTSAPSLVSSASTLVPDRDCGSTYSAPPANSMMHCGSKETVVFVSMMKLEPAISLGASKRAASERIASSSHTGISCTSGSGYVDDIVPSTTGNESESVSMLSGISGDENPMSYAITLVVPTRMSSVEAYTAVWFTPACVATTWTTSATCSSGFQNACASCDSSWRMSRI